MSSGDLAPREALGTPNGRRASSDVYARLYDKRSYTGVYRKRFELECHDLSECVVHDLSNTMRTNLKYDVDPRTKRSSSPRLTIAVPETAAVAVPVPVSSPQEKTAAVAEPSPMKLRGDPNDPHTLLKAVFHYYCRFGRTGAKGVGEKTLDNSNFSKLCRECPGLLDSTFASTDVDLIFIKAKKKGERRINYARFLDALGMIAIQKYNDLPLEASVPKLLEAHFARLSCMMEFTNGKMVQAIWQKRAERDDSASTLPSSSAVDLPPLPPAIPVRRTEEVAAAEASCDAEDTSNDGHMMVMPPPAPMEPSETLVSTLFSRGSSAPSTTTTITDDEGSE